MIPGIGFNIGNLFDAAFGITPVYKMPDSLGQNGSIDGFKDVEVDRESHFGTPVVGTITFEGGDYFVYSDAGTLERKSFDNFELPVALMASVRRAKRIKKTNTVASEGTVKELYGFDDWQITIRGVALPDAKQPQELVNPLDQINELYAWEKIAESIRVVGGLYLNREIHNIVIEDIDVRQLKGKPKVIPFMIRAVSDKPLELSV